VREYRHAPGHGAGQGAGHGGLGTRGSGYGARMRITGGRYGSRALKAPKGSLTRPTSDRVREALFSILGQRASADAVLDLYAGTGALGLEALSRGARSVVFVERGSVVPWKFGSGKDVKHVIPTGVFRTSDVEQMRMGVLEHLGIAQAPAWLFAAELREGTVLRLLTPYERTVPILAVRPASRRMPTKAEGFALRSISVCDIASSVIHK